jgi:hypothetical protein
MTICMLFFLCLIYLGSLNQEGCTEQGVEFFCDCLDGSLTLCLLSYLYLDLYNYLVEESVINYLVRLLASYLGS